jgi:hypothetical protein
VVEACLRANRHAMTCIKRACDAIQPSVQLEAAGELQ